MFKDAPSAVSHATNEALGCASDAGAPEGLVLVAAESPRPAIDQLPGLKPAPTVIAISARAPRE